MRSQTKEVAENWGLPGGGGRASAAARWSPSCNPASTFFRLVSHGAENKPRPATLLLRLLCLSLSLGALSSAAAPKPTELFPDSGTLHWHFPLSRVPHSQSQLKYRLLRGALSDHSHTHPPFFIRYPSWPFMIPKVCVHPPPRLFTPIWTCLLTVDPAHGRPGGRNHGAPAKDPHLGSSLSPAKPFPVHTDSGSVRLVG